MEPQPPKDQTRLSRIRHWPKSKRLALAAAGGLLVAVIVAAVAIGLSGGDSASLNASVPGSSTAAREAGQPAGGQSAASSAGGGNTSNTSSDVKTGPNASSNSNGQAAAAPAPPASATNTNPSAGSTITIKDMAFSPATLTVAKNTTVTWKNDDSTTHAIGKADNQAIGPHSPQLAPGASYSYSYSAAGTYKYVCVIHPQMTGTVVVKD